MNRVRLVGLVIALLALLAEPVSAEPKTGEGSPRVVGEQEVAEAIRFRTEQGFSTDESEIRHLLAETPDPQAEPFGTPLTAAELALMDRRGEIQAGLEAIRKYGKDHAAAWGGIWLTYPRGATLDRATNVNVNIVGSVDDHRVAVESLLPPGATATFHTVVRTEEDLREAHKPFHAPMSSRCPH